MALAQRHGWLRAELGFVCVQTKVDLELQKREEAQGVAGGEVCGPAACSLCTTRETCIQVAALIPAGVIISNSTSLIHPVPIWHPVVAELG